MKKPVCPRLLTGFLELWFEFVGFFFKYLFLLLLTLWSNEHITPLQLKNVMDDSKLNSFGYQESICTALGRKI